MLVSNYRAKGSNLSLETHNNALIHSPQAIPTTVYDQNININIQIILQVV
jgi:hypothetical protein